MIKPKVSVLVDEVALARGVMSTGAWTRLRQLAAVRFVKTSRLRPEQVRRLLLGADAVLTSWGSPRLEKELLDLAPNLRVIAHAAGSVRPVVSDEVWARKIVVTSAAAAISLNVAEYAMGCLILGLRRFMANVQHVRAGRWGLDHETGRMRSMAGANVGVVGAGFVGRAVIRHLLAFGANVAVYDPMLTAAKARELGVRKLALLPLARWSDAMTLHAPGIAATEGMIGAKVIAALRPNTLLVNTARGKLVDETALLKRLKRGDLAAFLDVTEPEPPARKNPLLSWPNVFVTPHVAGAGDFGRLGEYAVTELELVFAGCPARFPVTQAMLDTMA